MSTTFEIHPTRLEVPTFREVLLVATREFHAFLDEIGVKARPAITVAMHRDEPDEIVPLDLDTAARWDDDHYAFFQVDGVAGGADAYWREPNPLDPDDLSSHIEEMLERAPDEMREHVRRCGEIPYWWSIRRSSGQSAEVAVMYGFVASAFAELTDGVVFSGDSGWDSKRFPATAYEFSQWYFRPALALEDMFREWSAACIEDLRERSAANEGPAGEPPGLQ